MNKRVYLSVAVIFVIVGVTWLLYDITTPTFVCREINKSPIEDFGPFGVIKKASPEILSRKFHYRVDINNLSLDWKKYKEVYGREEYVHSHVSGGVTILTDNPSQAWKYIDGDSRQWIRTINGSIQNKQDLSRR
jgi:hypothetical protein